MQTLVIGAVPLSHYDRFTSASGPAPSPNYDPSKPQKRWVIAAADITGPTFTYDGVVKDADGYPKWTTNTIGVLDALSLNIPPAGGQSGVVEAPPILEPINKAAVLAAGLELCTDFMSESALCPSVMPVTTPIQWTQADHDALMADHAVALRLSVWLAKQGA